MVKPDGVQRGLVGEIIGRFERKGFKLRALKMYQTPKEVGATPSAEPAPAAVVAVSAPSPCLHLLLWLPLCPRLHSPVAASHPNAPTQTSRQVAEEHYKDLSSKPFYKDLVQYILSGPVVAMVRGLHARVGAWSGRGAGCMQAASELVALWGWWLRRSSKHAVNYLRTSPNAPRCGRATAWSRRRAS